jgi:signal transduction histidine kinase
MVSAVGEGVVLALRRVVVGYRVVGLVWLWLLVGIALRESRDHWTLLIGAGLLATIWTVATVSAAQRAPAVLRSPVWLALDIVVSGALIVFSSLVDPASSFSGGYPFSTVLVAGFAGGYPGAFSAAVLLSAVSVVRLGAGAAINSSLVYLAGAGVTVWGFDVLRRNEAQRRALEQRLAAEEAERVRSQERADTAAALHDSVLQTLALIQRRSDDPAAVAALGRPPSRPSPSP